jgi:hypothetical protein
MLHVGVGDVIVVRSLIPDGKAAQLRLSLASGQPGQQCGVARQISSRLTHTIKNDEGVGSYRNLL